MGYTGVRYIIKEGDTLWDLAAEKLGDPYAWPKIYAFNNQADVIAAGARRITDPDLIYAGATLMLPIAPGVKPAPAPSAARPPNMRSLKDQIPSIRMPARVAFDIQGQPIVLNYVSFVARIRQKGRVMIDMGSPVPLTMVANGGFEASVKTRAKSTFTTLMSENKVTFDPKTKGVTFSNKLVSSATNIPGPKTEVAIEMSSSSGMPKLKVAIAYPQIKGSLGNNRYMALDYKVEIEIEPRMAPLQPQPVPVPVHAPSPARAPRSTDWADVLRRASTGALIVAGVITVAYGASIVFSGGGTGLAAPAYANSMAVILVGATATTVAIQN